MCRSVQRREAQAPLGPIVRSLTSSGVLSRMSCAYLRSILSSLASYAVSTRAAAPVAQLEWEEHKILLPAAGRFYTTQGSTPSPRIGNNNITLYAPQQATLQASFALTSSFPTFLQRLSCLGGSGGSGGSGGAGQLEDVVVSCGLVGAN